MMATSESDRMTLNNLMMAKKSRLRTVDNGSQDFGKFFFTLDDPRRVTQGKRKHRLVISRTHTLAHTNTITRTNEKRETA